jgi:hypothetical protein
MPRIGRLKKLKTEEVQVRGRFGRLYPLRLRGGASGGEGKAESEEQAGAREGG